MPKPPTDALRAAAYLRLDLRPCGEPATTLIAALAAEVGLLGGRKNARRSEARRAAFHDAVGALVGGLLVNHQAAAESGRTRARASGQSTTPAPSRSGLSYRPRAKESFTGEPVSFRQFEAALRGLEEAGYVAIARGHRQFHGPGGDPGGFVGRSFAFRLWPTPRLLRAAEAAGLALAEVRRHVRPDPVARPRPPIVLHALSERHRGETVKGVRLSLPGGFLADRIAAEARAMNAFAAAHRVEVAGERVEAAWHRAFTIDFGLHGRWYARGDSYQGLPGDERPGLLAIDGEACAEVDVRASHLTCLHGHLGLPFDPALDPYDVPGVPRAVAKAWITAALGRGAALSGRAWPRRAAQHAREKGGLNLRTHPLPTVSQAVLARHPVLADLPVRFEALGHRYGVDAGRVLSLFLMGLEARALTAAMLALKAQGVLALPVHDSLAVPHSAVAAAEQALTAAFLEQLGVAPGLRVKAGAALGAPALAA